MKVWQLAAVEFGCGDIGVPRNRGIVIIILGITYAPVRLPPFRPRRCRSCRPRPSAENRSDAARRRECRAWISPAGSLCRRFLLAGALRFGIAPRPRAGRKNPNRFPARSSKRWRGSALRGSRRWRFRHRLHRRRSRRSRNFPGRAGVVTFESAYRLWLMGRDDVRYRALGNPAARSSRMFRSPVGAHGVLRDDDRSVFMLRGRDRG